MSAPNKKLSWPGAVPIVTRPPTTPLLAPTEPLLAVAPDKFTRGWRAEDQTGPATYEVLPLAEALARAWRTDAHAVIYVTVPVGAKQPLLTASCLAAWGQPVWSTVLLADVDNPKEPDPEEPSTLRHKPWTAELRAAADAQWASLPILATCGRYLTRGGLRLVQPLDRAVPGAEIGSVLRHWLDDLRAAGVVADMLPWTQRYRLPHVVRDGRPYRAEVQLERMRSIPPPAPLAAPSATRGPRIQRSGQSPFFKAAEAAGWLIKQYGDYWTMQCPWEHRHASPGGTAMYERRTKPTCNHTYCKERTFRDWLNALPFDARLLYLQLDAEEKRRNDEAALPEALRWKEVTR